MTLEDVVEEIVGDIHDESDIAEIDFKQLEPGRYLIDAVMPLREVNRRFNLELPEEHVTTLAGYFLQIFGKIPVEGDSCEAGDLILRVHRMEDRRIEEIEMVVLVSGEES